MKILKQRYESQELRIYRRLNVRGVLAKEDLDYLSYLEKGFEGEKKFDELVGSLSDNWLLLNDLLFECQKSEFQIDSFGITGDTIHIFEVKNFEGDYFIEDDRWYKVPKIDIKNPIEQLKRAEANLRRLLNEQRLNFRIEPHLVFVNSDFHLYLAPMNLPIIFPNQLRRFINYLNMQPSTLNANHFKLAQILLSIHKTESKYSQYPKYQYEQLKKGITCVSCHSLISHIIKKGKIVCHVCGCEEGICNAVLRSVEELKFLFPDRKITTNAVYEWCEIYKFKKGIRMILRDKFKMIGHGKYSYFV